MLGVSPTVLCNLHGLGYSGLINQTVIGIGITVLCVAGQEWMKRRRRGGTNVRQEAEGGLGRRESWEFG